MVDPSSGKNLKSFAKHTALFKRRVHCMMPKAMAMQRLQLRIWNICYLNVAILAKNSSDVSVNGAIPIQLHSCQLNSSLAENYALLCQHWITSTGRLAIFLLRERKNSAILRSKQNSIGMPKICHHSGWDKKCISRSRCWRNGTLSAQLPIKGITANPTMCFSVTAASNCTICTSSTQCMWMTKVNTVNNSNGLHIIEFHSPTAALIVLGCLVVLALFLCCKLSWWKTCSRYFKNHHGPSAPMVSNPAQPGALTSTLDNSTEILRPLPCPALRFELAAATNHQGLGCNPSSNQLWTYQKAPPQAHSKWNEI